MKKFLTTLSVALLTVILCVTLAGCGGATGVLSSYVSAVKKGDIEKASTYVVGQPELTNPKDSDNEVYDYIYDKTVGSFKYSVEETTVSEDETTATVEISYSQYSSVKLIAAYTVAYTSAVLKGEETGKSLVDDCLDEMEKTTGTATVLLVNDEDDGWLVAAVSATYLLTLIYS